ncbi:MAG: carboxypeptidase regulatory-like domain-containing protein [Rhodoglobus sp.]
MPVIGNAFRLVAAATVLSVAFAAPASAATTSDWAAWEPMTGTTNDFSGSVTIAANPLLVADFVTDSRAGSVGVISGATTWLSGLTPVGAKYGSSQDRPYVNLRPFADAIDSPSTTTYTFRTPTPPSGWTFVLGDIDADMVQISALGADGVAVTSGQLGYRSSFNYCVPGVCTPSQVPADVPDWDPTTSTLSADAINNSSSSDTQGAAAWFEPTVPITSLTLSYTRVTGLPIFQTWFASLARDITGTVTDIDMTPISGATVMLKDRTGAVVATTVTGAGGDYSFLEFIATDGYLVTLTPPEGTEAVGEAMLPADLTSVDAVVDFRVRSGGSTSPVDKGTPELAATGAQDSFATRLSLPLGLVVFGAAALWSAIGWRRIRFSISTRDSRSTS